MRDRELAGAFEACTLPPDQFTHRNHVRVAWIYLREGPDAFTRFSANLKRYAASVGAPGKYDEHITRTLLEIIAERMRTSRAGTFDAFLAENPDLLDWRNLVAANAAHARAT